MILSPDSLFCFLLPENFFGASSALVVLLCDTDQIVITGQGRFESFFLSVLVVV
jgi:hypothetical protein